MDKENIFQGKRVQLRSPEPSDGAIHFEMDTAYTNMARANYFVHFPDQPSERTIGRRKWLNNRRISMNIISLSNH